MLYIKCNGQAKPVVDLLMEEVTSLNQYKFRIGIMIAEKRFNSVYNELDMVIQDCEERIENYKRMLNEHNQTVGQWNNQTANG